jgi:glucose-6-phosphate isomerase
VEDARLIGMSISESPAWQALTTHHQSIGQQHLRDLFAADPTRGEELTLEVGDLYLDYSKNRIDRSTIGLLADLARAAGVRCSLASGSTPRKIAPSCTSPYGRLPRR